MTIDTIRVPTGFRNAANPPILRLNERLGYRRLPGWLIWEKRLS